MIEYRLPPLPTAAERTFVLRKARQKRHVRIGETFSLKPANGSPSYVETCTYRSTVRLDKTGLVRVLNPSFTPEGDPLFQLFQAGEQGASQAETHALRIAEADGFGSWASLYAFYADPALDDVQTFEVIGWAAPQLAGADQEG